jgi:hypothetical protein
VVPPDREVLARVGSLHYRLPIVTIKVVGGLRGRGGRFRRGQRKRRGGFWRQHLLKQANHLRVMRLDVLQALVLIGAERWEAQDAPGGGLKDCGGNAPGPQTSSFV